MIAGGLLAAPLAAAAQQAGRMPRAGRSWRTPPRSSWPATRSSDLSTLIASTAPSASIVTGWT